MIFKTRLANAFQPVKIKGLKKGGIILKSKSKCSLHPQHKPLVWFFCNNFQIWSTNCCQAETWDWYPWTLFDRPRYSFMWLHWCFICRSNFGSSNPWQERDGRLDQASQHSWEYRCWHYRSSQKYLDWATPLSMKHNAKLTRTWLYYLY